MSRSRLGVVLILLVLILIVASILFGVLTYGLDGEGQPPSTPDQESMRPGRMMDWQYTNSGSGMLRAKPATKQPNRPKTPVANRLGALDCCVLTISGRLPGYGLQEVTNRRSLWPCEMEC